ncbi:hypothetical protein IWX90DRAFT_474899 [Phyllosticta citrichinensis]|uniref:Uncharacterized protein n=1 Tax=Phyllosticta citrichinensis TaxID=1130410 RepID=A0ABR1Y8R3_9PEZI
MNLLSMSLLRLNFRQRISGELSLGDTNDSCVKDEVRHEETSIILSVVFIKNSVSEEVVQEAETTIPEAFARGGPPGMQVAEVAIDVATRDKSPIVVTTANCKKPSKSQKQVSMLVSRTSRSTEELLAAIRPKAGRGRRKEQPRARHQAMPLALRRRCPITTRATEVSCLEDAADWAQAASWGGARHFHQERISQEAQHDRERTKDAQSAE